MKNLVRRMRYKTVCDTYMCNNIAEFEVGHEITPALATHYCKDCMKTIVEEAEEILLRDFGDSSVSEKASVTEEAENQNEKEISATEQEYYICKRCGAKFKKPDELTEYRRHIVACNNALHA